MRTVSLDQLTVLGVRPAELVEIAARGIVTLQFDSDETRGFDRFCQLREWACELNLPLLLEFTPLSQVASLTDALNYRLRAGQENIGILVDLFHLHRSGGVPSDMLSVDDGVILGAQLCDGPSKQTVEEYADQALYERRVPGEGDLPVQTFIAALPRELTIGVEVPLRSCKLAGEGHLQRATRLMQATRAVLANVERDG